MVSYGGTVIEMLSVPTGHNGSNGKMGREGLSDCRLMDHKNGSDLVLTYKDKDGDWMLVWHHQERRYNGMHNENVYFVGHFI